MIFQISFRLFLFNDSYQYVGYGKEKILLFFIAAVPFFYIKVKHSQNPAC